MQTTFIAPQTHSVDDETYSDRMQRRDACDQYQASFLRRYYRSHAPTIFESGDYYRIQNYLTHRKAYHMDNYYDGFPVFALKKMETALSNFLQMNKTMQIDPAKREFYRTVELELAEIQTAIFEQTQEVIDG